MPETPDARAYRRDPLAVAAVGPGTADRLAPRAVWLAMGLVALGLGDCARVVAGARLAPREEDWSTAAQVVRKDFRRGDLLVAAPGWADAMMRLHLGDLLPVEVAARADADRFARVWEVSVHGAQAPETATPARCTPLLQGRVAVRRCDKPATPVVWDLLAEAARARAVILRGDQVIASSLPPAVVVGEIDYRPHRCALLPPPAAGQVLRAEWSDVVLGRTLVGYTGIHSFYARKAAQGPVRVVVRLGDAELAHFTHESSDGWRRFEIPTPAGTRGALRLEVSSPDPRERKLCVAMEARP